MPMFLFSKIFFRALSSRGSSSIMLLGFPFLKIFLLYFIYLFNSALLPRTRPSLRPGGCLLFEGCFSGASGSERLTPVWAFRAIRVDRLPLVGTFRPVFILFHTLLLVLLPSTIRFFFYQIRQVLLLMLLLLAHFATALYCW